MLRFLLLFTGLFVLSGFVYGQAAADSTRDMQKDTLLDLKTPGITGDSASHPGDTLAVLPSTESVSKMPRKDTGWIVDPATPFFRQNLERQLLDKHPYFGFTKPPVSFHAVLKKRNGKEFLFYLLVFLLIIFGLLRQAFSKYFNDLFRLFFRTTLKIRLISDQLMETPLPSLLLNGYFIVTGSLYITFQLQHFNIGPEINFWLLFLYGILGLSGIYLTKFIGLKICGWLFHTQEAANSYIFIVFIINKMIGILLIPFLIVMAFASGEIYNAALILSWCMIAALLVYRVILTFGAVRNRVKVNPFHFFLYVCAFEIAPLLLIYKGLLLFFRITA